MSSRPVPAPRRSIAAAAALVAVLLCIVPAARADVSSIQAEATPRSLNIGETFSYQVMVEGRGTLPTPSNNIPDAFQILSGPNSNFSMQIVNGRMSSKRTLSYTLRALRRGEHTIPAPIVRDGGRDIRGNAVTITVAAPTRSTTPAQPGQPGGTQPQATPPAEPETFSGRDLPSIFLRAEVDDSEVYLQEALVVSFTLYFQPSVQTFDVTRLPSTKGFWTEQWEVPSPPPVVERNLGGSLYNAAVIHRLILYPTRTGELEIGPMDIVVQFLNSRRSRDLFDSIFRNSYDSREVSSEPLTVTVNPLPDADQPDDFTNIVGDWRMNAHLDAGTVKTNESVTLTVTISGTGNVGFLPQPDLRVPPDIELYDPEEDVQKDPVNGEIQGRKTFTWLLIPRRAGEQRIPPVTLHYFDPEAEEYKTIQADPGTLQVLPSDSWTADNGNNTGGAPAPVESVGRDIRWIMDSAPSLDTPGPPLHRRAGYWSLYLLPALIVLAGVATRRRRDRLAGQESLQRSRKAARRAIAALKEARAMLRAGQVEQGYDALARGLMSYLAERLNLPAATLDQRKRHEVFARIGVSDASCAELDEILSTCDSARFSPHGRDESTLATLIDRAQAWITSVDRKLKPVA